MIDFSYRTLSNIRFQKNLLKFIKYPHILLTFGEPAALIKRSELTWNTETVSQSLALNLEQVPEFSIF